jgi:hypothetical protein
VECLDCEPFREPRDFATPGQLENAMRVLRSWVSDGMFQVSARPAGGSGDQPPFPALPERAPWPDAFGYEFRCSACGSRYALTGESYHGRGARWSVVELAT